MDSLRLLAELNTCTCRCWFTAQDRLLNRVQVARLGDFTQILPAAELLEAVTATASCRLSELWMTTHVGSAKKPNGV